MLYFLKWAWDELSAKTIVRRLLRVGWLCVTHPIQTFRIARFVVVVTKAKDADKVGRLGASLACRPLHRVFSALIYTLIYEPSGIEIILKLLRAQASHPNAHRAWQWRLVDALIHLKRWDEALHEGLELERRMVPKVPDRFLSTMATIYREMSDHESALKKCSEALLAAPSKPWLRFDVAREYFELGRLDECREQVRKCVVECTHFRGGSRTDQYKARTHAAHGMKWMGQLHGALEAYHQAASVTRSADPCLQAAKMYREMGETGKALEMIDEAIRREPWRKSELTDDTVIGKE